MGVSLYTSRIVLHTLGVEDFGIYNVVGGVVMMFSFLNSSMSSATQRFLSFEMGKQDYAQLKKVFSMSVNIHAIIAVVILVLAETIGLWFFNAKLVIPAERMDAANWVYQFSIFSFMLTILNVPYSAAIIAHERMKVYAWVSIVEVMLKLIIVFALVCLGFDKLKLYAVLVFGVSVVIWAIYKIYCKRNFTETNYHFFWEKSLYKTLINYAGWNLFGNLSYVCYTQGLNILLNIFFGPVINAARGIAYQIQGAVNGFVGNFQMAVNPQIIKSYALKDYQYMNSLIYNSSKYSFYLLFIIATPVLYNTEYLLTLWLKNLPTNAIIFTKLMIINALIDVFANPLGFAAQATGKIKLFQLIVGGVLLLNLPISYIFLKHGFGPETVFYLSIAFSSIAIICRLIIVSKILNISIINYLNQVIFPVLMVIIFSSILPLLCLNTFTSAFGSFIFVSTVVTISNICIIYLIGINKTERIYIINKIKLILK